MKQLPSFSEAYFNKFSTKPVVLKSYDPQSPIIAHEYITQLKKLLQQFPKVEIVHRGSTLFGILGKGDIEMGLYIPEDQWFDVLILLINYYKEIGNLEKDYARFNDEYKGYEIEVILFTGYNALVDKRVTEYMKNNTDLLKKYEYVKRKYAYSKREYQIQKDKFFRKVIEDIPD